MSLHSQNRVVCSIHEAAHIVVALALDIDVVHAQIGEKCGVKTRYPAHRHPDVQAVYAARQGIISLSGPIAEMYFAGERDAVACAADQKNAERHAQSFLRLREGLAQDAALADAEARVAEKLDLWKLRAQQLVTDSLNQIRAVAVALIARGALTGPEILEILKNEAAGE